MSLALVHGTVQIVRQDPAGNLVLETRPFTLRPGQTASMLGHLLIG